MRFSTIFVFLSNDIVRNFASGKSRFTPYISNGNEAVPHQYPWMARMVIDKSTTDYTGKILKKSLYSLVKFHKIKQKSCHKRTLC